MVYRLTFYVFALAILVGLSLPTNLIADVPIFFQDFESGLGANESTSGTFAINNTNAPLNNGSRMMGHPTSYASNDLSTYEVDIELGSFATASMTFDYRAQFEQGNNDFGPDGFVVRANPVNVAQPIDVIFPTNSSDLQYTFHPNAVGDLLFYGNLGPTYYHANSGTVESGIAEYNLDAFAGNTLTLRFLFDADNSIHSFGFNMDNLEIRGELRDPAVPEPTGLLLVSVWLSLFITQRSTSEKTKHGTPCP
jgi:hypothetical protein